MDRRRQAGAGEQVEREKAGSVKERPERDQGKCCHVADSFWNALADQELTAQAQRTPCIVCMNLLRIGQRTECAPKGRNCTGGAVTRGAYRNTIPDGRGTTNLLTESEC